MSFGLRSRGRRDGTRAIDDGAGRPPGDGLRYGAGAAEGRPAPIDDGDAGTSGTASGAGRSLDTAFQENADRLYRFIFAKVGNKEAAEDLTSQVFLKAARWLALDRSADSVRAWLYTTARGTIADYWREQSQHQSVQLDEESATLLWCGTDSPAEVRRTRDRAWRVLDALPEREREVLRLRFLHGYTAAEIGQARGMTAGNVRVVQLRALRHAASLVLGGGNEGPDGLHSGTDGPTDTGEGTGEDVRAANERGPDAPDTVPGTTAMQIPGRRGETARGQ